jgi:glycerol-3-phosphate dehydrogenase (NAD(P)+)
MNQFINEPITVIGGGTWGTVVGNLIANNGHKVKLWARDPFVVHSISTRSFNERFLPNLRLHENLIALDDPREALANTKIIIWAIPVQFTRERVRDFKNFFEPQSIVVNLSKGLEGGTLYRPSQIFFEEYQYFKAVGSLGGPNIASEQCFSTRVTPIP